MHPQAQRALIHTLTCDTRVQALRSPRCAHTDVHRHTGTASSTQCHGHTAPRTCTQPTEGTRVYIHHVSTHMPTCSSQPTRSPSWHPRTCWAAQLNPKSREGHLHPQEGPAGSALRPHSCSTSGEGWTHDEEGVAAPAPPQPGHRHQHLPAPGARAAAPQDTPILQDLPKQSTHQGCVDATRGAARHGAPTPCIPRTPSREGQGETEARFTGPSPAPGQPPAVPAALSSVSGKGGGHRRSPQPVPTRPEWP